MLLKAFPILLLCWSYSSVVGKDFHSVFHKKKCNIIWKWGSAFSWLYIYDMFHAALKQFEANPDAKRLYDDLLSNYNRLIRPVVNNSETLTVWLGIKLSQLIEVNLKNQVMTTNLWVPQVSNNMQYIYSFIEESFIRMVNSFYNRNIYLFRNGSITNCAGIRRNMVALKCCTFRPSTFGCQTLFCITIGMAIMKWDDNFSF